MLAASSTACIIASIASLAGSHYTGSVFTGSYSKELQASLRIVVVVLGLMLVLWGWIVAGASVSYGSWDESVWVRPGDTKKQAPEHVYGRCVIYGSSGIASIIKR